MVNRAPRAFPESTQCNPQGEDRRSPKGFSKGKPEAFGLAEDAAQGSPLENFKGGLQYSSKGVHRELKGAKGAPEGSIHQDTSHAFPQIFIPFYLTHFYIT